MDVQRLKEHIINNDFVPQILECLKCHDIKDKGEYYQCANPDGDNLNAITVYKNSLYTIDYTRNIEQKNISDIFNLVMFFQHCNLAYITMGTFVLKSLLSQSVNIFYHIISHI